jgi:hypothetical protein
VLAEANPCGRFLQERLKAGLAIEQRPLQQSLAVEVQQIEGE